MGMEWCNSYHYTSAIFIEPFQAGIKICSDGRICGSQWGIFAQVILPLPIINYAAQCVLCSHFGIDWNVHEFFAPETLLFSCSNLFSVIVIHSTGSWSKWLLVLGNLRASTLQVRSLNDHLLSSQKTCVFRGLLCVSENFVFRDGNLSSVMNWLNSCRLINNTARTGRFLLKWTNQVTGNTDLSYLKWYTHFVLSCLKGSPLSWQLCRSHNIELLHLTGAVYTEPALSKSLMTFSLEESLMVDRLA